MKYAIQTKVYDDGKIFVSPVYEVKDSAKDTYEQYNTFDIYVDVFNTKKEALEFKDEAKDA